MAVPLSAVVLRDMLPPSAIIHGNDRDGVWDVEIMCLSDAIGFRAMAQSPYYGWTVELRTGDVITSLDASPVVLSVRRA